MSFASTLYLCPVLEILLVNVPPEWQAEVRLGLQEALVNAAKHGNNLDPSKTIVVKFTVTTREYSWIIVDEGQGFTKEQDNIAECGYRTNQSDRSSTSTDTPISLDNNPTISQANQRNSFDNQLPSDESENGRGFSILHHVFDCVHWNRDGTQLTLSKEIANHKSNQPSIC